MLKFETRDRRRATVATVATLLVLPALWVVNQSSEDRSPSAPHVAAVGVGGVDGDETAPATTGDRRANLDHAALEPSIFISADRQRSTARVVDVATPTSRPGDPIRAHASFNSGIAPGRLCVGIFQEGTTVTVRNVNNNRSTTCLVVGRTERVNPDPGVIMLERNTYLEIASASDAPVPVEIRR